MKNDVDPLWDPDAPADAELVQLSRLLRPLGADARGLDRELPLPTPTPARGGVGWRWGAGLAASVATLALLLWGWTRYRLEWEIDRPWLVHSVQGGAHEVAQLLPGGVLRSAADQTFQLSVARIGGLTLSPGSSLRLLHTAPEQHRVRLEHGHLRARIWAPPGYFGVAIGTAEAVDLGCEFELWKATDGSGQLTVHSGWVQYQLGQRDVLVPAPYTLHFSAAGFGVPLRASAAPAFRAAVDQLTQVLAGAAYASEWAAASAAVADLAADADAYTLLTLLAQHPHLAAGPIYPRLASALHAPQDARHRRAWVDGDRAAVDAWWSYLPSQPKQWWRNWADAF